MTETTTRETDMVIYAALKSCAQALYMLRSALLSLAAVYEKRLGRKNMVAVDSSAYNHSTMTITVREESEKE